MLRKPLWMLALGVALGWAAPACVGGSDGTSLNPQPLPPGETEETGGGEGEAPGSDRGTGGSSGSTGGGMSPPQAGMDGGTSGDGEDAGDAGDGGE